jgi:hypothetical protein
MATMATPGSELVRPHIFSGSLAEVEKQLEQARQRGLLHGEQYTVARLKDGRFAVKVWMVDHHDPVKPTAPVPPASRWPLTNKQTFWLTLSLIVGATVVAVVWLIIDAVRDLATWSGHHSGPIVGVVIVLAVLALIGGGGGTFSGTFSGSWK